eukprot:679614-Amphidinium_carterae.1
MVDCSSTVASELGVHSSELVQDRLHLLSNLDNYGLSVDDDVCNGGESTSFVRRLSFGGGGGGGNWAMGGASTGGSDRGSGGMPRGSALSV